MAGDWIKMRVHLRNDPKVIFMANWMASQREFMDWLTDPVRATCKDSAYEHVTRRVTVAVTVDALLVTWGVTREQGTRVGDDLVMACCNAEIVSAIADVPCFGEAMVRVGWLVEDYENNSASFPNFFADKDSPEVRHRTSNAERQARYRNRRNASNVTSNVTEGVTRNVTSNAESNGEKRREEKNNNTPLPPLEIPEVLQVDSDFMEAWNLWKTHRRELKKPMKQSQERLLLAQFVDWGSARAIAAIRYTVAKGWQGLREPEKSELPKQTGPRLPTDEELANWNPITGGGR